MGLLLRAVDVAGPLRWRWLLTDADTGASLADHQVNLEAARDEVARFNDLSGYLRSYAAPDRQVEDGTRIVADAGAWAGSVLLGDAVGDAIAAAATAGPVTVQVIAPAPADAVLLWPLELAHAAGRPLAARGDVTFVYDIAGQGLSGVAARSGQPAGRGRAPGAPLRVLAVFSQPTRTSVLALRRERHALARLIRRLAARERAVVELRVLQYGVTRKILGDIAGEGDGWDLLHLSGHGAGGAFLLEKSDGSTDVVSTVDLVGLLRPMRGRVRLAVVSACSSAADATARTYRLLGLAQQAQALEAQASQVAAEEAAEIPGLARALVRDLGSPVIGMRYAVTDEFAVAFGGELYEQILGRKVSVDVAVARALVMTINPGVQPSDAIPAISLATPGMFGAHDPGLKVDIPRGQPVLDPAKKKMAYFPDEPARFVGRAAAMARASAALAPDSGQSGILLHGMAGAGKTACALELAYRHQDAFSVLAFWQAPANEDEWASGLADFAARLDIQLADYGFTMTSHIATEASLQAFAPRLRRLLADAGILLVLDNLETLLTPGGTWRDPRWGVLVAALTTHDGESRVILTSRIVPAGLPATVAVQPVHALSLGEAAALARELPNLRALLHADIGPLRNDASAVDADRHRVRRVLRVVQGHPKLMELADAAAVARERLDRQLDAAEQAVSADAAGRGLDAFFHDGESAMDPAEFLATLGAWTQLSVSELAPSARLMAGFVAGIEEAHRRSDVIWSTWGRLWRRLGRPGDPPDPGPLLASLAQAALVEDEPLTGFDVSVVQVGGNQGGTVGEAGVMAHAEDADRADETGRLAEAAMAQPPTAYRMHPGVAAVIAATAEPSVRDAVDAEVSLHWRALADWALRGTVEEDSAQLVRHALAAAPYLLRRGDWDIASGLLRAAVVRDASPGTLQAVIPSLRRIADATGKSEDVGHLGSALRYVDPAEAEQLLRKAVDAAVTAGEFGPASVHAEGLCGLLMDVGRPHEALAMVERMVEFTRQAGLGPWSQLADRSWRLRVLGQIGEHEQVFAEVQQLRSVMAELPEHTGQQEVAPAWYGRESILLAGVTSAQATKKWARSLELNEEIVASKRQRGAGEHEIARTYLNSAQPLMELDQPTECQHLLAKCQRVFKDHADAAGLAAVFSHRAALEIQLGDPREAVNLQFTALRLSYQQPEIEFVAVTHERLAMRLTEAGGDMAARRAHRLAAAVIYRLSGLRDRSSNILRTLDVESRRVGADPSLPSTVAQMVRIAERTEGVHLAALLAALEPDPDAVESVLAEILAGGAAA